MSPYIIFLLSAGCGVLSGIVYDFLYIIRSLICGMPAKVYTAKDRVFACICDVLYFAALTALYIFCSVYFDFPDIRLYMIAAVFTGIALYIKSFHKVVAFFANRMYNKIVKR